ncbi:MAG TPA: hypothetical protein PLQ71_23240, partial [Nitrospira sp.]|nr:hypothetical protein [Nitrospira sp.]
PPRSAMPKIWIELNIESRTLIGALSGNKNVTSGLGAMPSPEVQVQKIHRNYIDGEYNSLSISMRAMPQAR